MYSIGDISGSIWNHLNISGRSQYKKVKDAVLSEFDNLPMKEQRFSMAVGWLAREDKLSFVEEGKGRRYRLYLELK
ncbi:MAG: winged helix-turn-helix domain-containing protein [Candidatus Muiribacteriaceae bacterium]